MTNVYHFFKIFTYYLENYDRYIESLTCKIDHQNNSTNNLRFSKSSADSLFELLPLNDNFYQFLVFLPRNLN